MSDPDPRRYVSDSARHGLSEPKKMGKGHGASNLPKTLPGARHPNYGKKFPAGWKGSLGPLGDPRSRVAKLVLKIERTELIPIYGVPQDIGVAGVMRETAQWRALARTTLMNIGIDKSATARKAAGLSRMATSKESELRQLVGKVTAWSPTSGRDIMALRARWQVDGTLKPTPVNPQRHNEGKATS
jgi:hypothetical protein